jgi:hypothetical protein
MSGAVCGCVAAVDKFARMLLNRGEKVRRKGMFDVCNQPRSHDPMKLLFRGSFITNYNSVRGLMKTPPDL